jgi:hypothetical protein
MQLPQVIRRRTDKFSVFRRNRQRRAASASLLAAGMLVICGTAVGALPAHAATITDSSAASAAAATPYQNKVLDGAMTRVAGGTRVSASEVEWDHGKIVMGVSPADASATAADLMTPDVGPTEFYAYNTQMGSKNYLTNCSPGWFCAWGSANWQGTCWMYIYDTGAGYELDWAAYSNDWCGDLGTWSWVNATKYRVWKEAAFTNATPASTYLWKNGTASGNSWCIGPGDENTDVTDNISRQLGWIQMTSNTSNC